MKEDERDPLMHRQASKRLFEPFAVVRPLEVTGRGVRRAGAMPRSPGSVSVSAPPSSLKKRQRDRYRERWLREVFRATVLSQPAAAGLELRVSNCSNALRNTDCATSSASAGLPNSRTAVAYTMS